MVTNNQNFIFLKKSKLLNLIDKGLKFSQINKLKFFIFEKFFFNVFFEE